MAVDNYDTQVAKLKQLISMTESELMELLKRNNLSPVKRQLIESRLHKIQQDTSDRVTESINRKPVEKNNNGRRKE